ncbi:hypothetical protein K0M31_008838 [Melipona bicolor]|uniref:C2H2-type domain-containing protein n=1 Tax=Melipona bicolor TaxID=60889 RepID=A0AA40FQK9_9HYME|nr:hypothetical protein K0M31_008838 [Melipona bicolor]
MESRLRHIINAKGRPTRYHQTIQDLFVRSNTFDIQIEEVPNPIENYGWNRAVANRKVTHPRVRHKVLHICPKCGRSFNWRYNLQHHLKYACGQLPRFNCPYCAYRTKHTSNVRAHVRRKHPDKEVYVVDLMSVQH